jgi:hypothetical protein
MDGSPHLYIYFPVTSNTGTTVVRVAETRLAKSRFMEQTCKEPESKKKKEERRRKKRKQLGLRRNFCRNQTM